MFTMEKLMTMLESAHYDMNEFRWWVRKEIDPKMSEEQST